MRRDAKIAAASLVFPHLDVSVRYVDVVEEADGRADVPHDLRRLWEEQKEEKEQSLKPEAAPGWKGNVGKKK